MKYIRTKMKYIRTKTEIKEIGTTIINNKELFDYLRQFANYKDDLIKVADTIEELCDERVAIRKSNHKPYLGHFSGRSFFQEDSGWLGRLDSYENIYCAIWTKGKHDEPILKSVAKMKGVLPNGEIDWELL